MECKHLFFKQAYMHNCVLAQSRNLSFPFVYENEYVVFEFIEIANTFPSVFCNNNITDSLTG